MRILQRIRTSAWMRIAIVVSSAVLLAAQTDSGGAKASGSAARLRLRAGQLENSLEAAAASADGIEHLGRF